jgi:hypothetical protein
MTNTVVFPCPPQRKTRKKVKTQRLNSRLALQIRRGNNMIAVIF